jgi:hypothetical protein
MLYHDKEIKSLFDVMTLFKKTKCLPRKPMEQYLKGEKQTKTLGLHNVLMRLDSLFKLS